MTVTDTLVPSAPTKSLLAVAPVADPGVPPANDHEMVAPGWLVPLKVNVASVEPGVVDAVKLAVGGGGGSGNPATLMVNVCCASGAVPFETVRVPV